MGKLKAPYRNYEANQVKILEAYKRLADGGNVLPSYDDLAKEADVSLSTVKRHFKHLDFDYVCKRQRIFTPEVVDAIRKSAIEGKPRAQKLYAQIVEGYIEKKDHKETIVGDLNVNADVSGELKVNIQRGVIKSKEDLQALQGLVDAAKVLTSDKPIEDETIKEIKKKVPALIENVESMIFFK